MLTRRGIDFSSCSERHELEALLQTSAEKSDHTSEGTAEETPDDMDTELSKISNLLDTFPASMQLLKRDWSDRRSSKIADQLIRVKELLSLTKKQGGTMPSWHARLIEYNDLAKSFKQIRDAHAR